jgi:hypothetical protein
MDEQRQRYWDECGQLATELRTQMATFAVDGGIADMSERDARQWADHLRVLELALWTAAAEARWREATRADGRARAEANVSMSEPRDVDADSAAQRGKRLETGQ